MMLDFNLDRLYSRKGAGFRVLEGFTRQNPCRGKVEQVSDIQAKGLRKSLKCCRSRPSVSEFQSRDSPGTEPHSGGVLFAAHPGQVSKFPNSGSELPL